MIDRCSSSVGRTARGEQKVNLHQYCWLKGIVIHEIAHAIGFFHEQSRTDRNSYVNIIYQNIEVGKIPGALHVPFRGAGLAQCLGFDSRTRRHMWAEFVGSLLCSERFFSGNSGFPLSSKTNI